MIRPRPDLTRLLALVAVGSALMVGATLVGAMPALGSCMEPPPPAEHLAQADAVFIGTVTGLRNGNRTATFAVEEQWSGPSLPAMVEVFGGPDEAFSATSADRMYEAGVRYLVAVSVSDGRLNDNSCSATQPWTDGLAALRPPDVRTPIADDESNPAGVPTPLLVTMAGVAVLLGVGFVAFRRGGRTAT